jgi:hypothetical protein
VKASTAKQKNKEAVMKNSVFSKVFGRHVVSALLVASTTLALGNLAAAADANDLPSRTSIHQKSGTAAHDDNDGSSLWEQNLRTDRFDGAQLVEAQFAPAPYCHTFAGPVCSMSVALPAGSSCGCPSVWGYLPGITGF